MIKYKFLLIFVILLLALFKSVNAGCCTRNNECFPINNYLSMGFNTEEEYCEFGGGQGSRGSYDWYANNSDCSNLENNKCEKLNSISELQPAIPEKIINNTKEKKPIIFVPNVPIPGFSNNPDGYSVTIESNTIGRYIAVVYRYLLTLGVALAVFVFMYAGITWILATGDQGKIQNAREYIISSVIGVILLFSSYWILYFINPALIDPNSFDISDKNIAENKYESTDDSETVYEGGITAVQDVSSIGGSWIFDSGIQNQVGDASTSLAGLLTCMRTKIINTNIGRISSISQSGGNWVDKCYRENWSDPSCAHGKNSCHYGGKTCPKFSYAVDFGDENNESTIKSAAIDCGAGYVLGPSGKWLKLPNGNITTDTNPRGHTNHVHISVNNDACGCY